MVLRLLGAALARAAAACCCGAACEAACSSEIEAFDAQCQVLAREACELQIACRWASGEPCDDCGAERCAPSCRAMFEEGFQSFRRFSASTMLIMDESGKWVGETFTAMEKEALMDGNAAAYRRKQANQRLDEASDVMLLISDASQKVLNCWALDGRFWYVHLVHPYVGFRSSTMCVPSCCSQAELETELAATFFNHLANTFEAQMFNVTSKEVSHWADLPLDFLIIGLDGCGTTSLRRNLAKHPDLNFTHLSVFSQDEDFFIIEMGRQTLPFMWQVQRVVEQRARMRGLKLGMYQPTMWSEEVLEHTLAYLPDLRIVVAVCDPVDRFERKLHLELEPTGDSFEETVKRQAADTRYAYFADALASWKRNFAERVLFIDRDLQDSPHTLARITDFLGIRPFPQHVRFKRYNSRGRKRTALCSWPELVLAMKEVFKHEYRILEELLGNHAGERLRRRLTRCEAPDGFEEENLKWLDRQPKVKRDACHCFYCQRSTVWVSAAAYDKTAFFGLQRQQALHICADSAPPWHLPDRWALDGIKRIGDVCEDTDEAEPEAGPYLEAGAESEEEDFQLQQVLQRSRLEVTGCDQTSGSSSSSSKPNPQLAALQELTGCSLLQAEQALATTGSIDAAAEALLGCADSDLPATRDSDSPKKRPELELEDDRLAKKPKSEAGTNCQAGAASGPGFQVVWRGELAKKLKSSSAVIDLCD
ncbi:unnamed protein product [Effrenium voratum]|nr:unnamed protein product [Effrenium voratum]